MHKFIATATGSTTCAECGKTRNAKPHKDFTAAAKAEALAAAEALDTQLAEDQIAEEEAAEAAAKAAKDDAEREAAEQALLERNEDATSDNPGLDDEGTAKPRTSARRIPADTVGSFWLGWRVAEAAAQGTDSLAAKVQASKPTQLRYYRVHLTMPEIKALDTLAASFEEPGNTGYAIRAARTLRVEIAKVLKAQA